MMIFGASPLELLIGAALFGTMFFATVAYPFSAYTFARKTKRNIALWLVLSLLPVALPAYIFIVPFVDMNGWFGALYSLWLILGSVCFVWVLRLPGGQKRNGDTEVSTDIPISNDIKDQDATLTTEPPLPVLCRK